MHWTKVSRAVVDDNAFDNAAIVFLAFLSGLLVGLLHLLVAAKRPIQLAIILLAVALGLDGFFQN